MCAARRRGRSGGGIRIPPEMNKNGHEATLIAAWALRTSSRPIGLGWEPVTALIAPVGTQQGGGRRYGLMFWLRRKRLAGSYWFFSATRRSYCAGP